MDKTIEKVILETPMSYLESYYRIHIDKERTSVFLVNERHDIEKMIIQAWPVGLNKIYEIFKNIEEYEQEHPEFIEMEILNRNAEFY